ncbi:hypothetical protein EON63_08720 [archaeon]|nr:MAG: hypothetical protein EON63_08720 [archaeon]
MRGPNISSTYIFKGFGSSWSLQSKLVSYNLTTGDGAESEVGYVRPHITNFTNPVQWGGSLFHQVTHKITSSLCITIGRHHHILFTIICHTIYSIHVHRTPYSM